MNFLRGLFGGTGHLSSDGFSIAGGTRPVALELLPSATDAPGSYHPFVVEVVGESHYQPVLQALAAGSAGDDEARIVNVVLAREPHNPYDANAVAVYAGRPDARSPRVAKVGYLPRELAAAYLSDFGLLTQMGYTVGACEGLIVGGPEPDFPHSEPSFFGIWLNMGAPGALIPPA